MTDLLQSLDEGIAATHEPLEARTARHARAYRCRCGAPVFFANTQCLTCQARWATSPTRGAHR